MENLLYVLRDKDRQIKVSVWMGVAVEKNNVRQLSVLGEQIPLISNQSWGELQAFLSIVFWHQSWRRKQNTVSTGWNNAFQLQ